MAKLSPVFNDQTVDTNGNPAVGYKLFTYAAGSATKQPTFSDDAGLVPNSNPIILNADGWPNQGPIWLTEGQSYKFVLALPTDSDPPTSPVKTIDDVTGVGDSSVSISQWQPSGVSPIYIGETSFSMNGDQTNEFHVGRELQLIVSSGVVYGLITSSIFDSVTTVELLMDAGDVLDPGLSQVNLSILRADHPAVPANSGFISGTRMLFLQSTAPIGWTKDTTHDNKALRIVSGDVENGGSVDFTTAFSSKTVAGTVGNTTLSITQIPNHNHIEGWAGSNGNASYGVANAPAGNMNTQGGTSGSNHAITSSAGSGGAHAHSFTGTAIDMAVKYVDAIIAQRD